MIHFVLNITRVANVTSIYPLLPLPPLPSIQGQISGDWECFITSVLSFTDVWSDAVFDVLTSDVPTIIDFFATLLLQLTRFITLHRAGVRMFGVLQPSGAMTYLTSDVPTKIDFFATLLLQLARFITLNRAGVRMFGF